MYLLKVAVFTALLLAITACGSGGVRPLDPIQLESVEKGAVLAVVDNYRIYKIEDGRVSCYLAIWPGYADTAISCVSQ